MLSLLFGILISSEKQQEREMGRESSEKRKEGERCRERKKRFFENLAARREKNAEEDAK